MPQGRPLVGRLLFLFAAFVACYLGATMGGLGTPEVGASHNFGDVPDSAFYHAFVDYLAQSGVTAGCASGQYCPEQAVTRGQMAVFLGQLRLLAGCPPDSVRVASTCVDTYEASVWQTTNAALIQKIRLGTVTLADLTAAGAVQRGVNIDDYVGAGCQDTGAGCTTLYAVSIPGVTPSSFMNWFQAVAFARNAGKRMPTNAEWQAAALATPDGAPCIVAAAGSRPTGTAGCVSDVGAFDMVGNLQEWVADWVPRSDAACPGWGMFSDDRMCVSGAPSVAGGPGALLRGGNFNFGAFAGVFAVSGGSAPSSANFDIGFRAAR